MLGRITGRAFARAGLLGNPSDAYGGKAIACSVFELGARVSLEAAGRFEIVSEPAALDSGGGGDAADGARDTHAVLEAKPVLEADTVLEAVASLREHGCRGASSLLRAALLRFAEHCAATETARATATGPSTNTATDPLHSLAADDPRLRFRMRFESDIPFQAGLAGSSAIVIAALRALAAWFGSPLAPFDQAELALAAELEDLGIAAGPMDRAIQAFEGALAMDFAGPRTRESYAPVDPLALPPLFLAWHPEGGEPSGGVHRDVRRRWLAGDPEVRAIVQRFRDIVDEGLGCLARHDARGFRDLANRNFDARAELFPIGARDRAMVELGRAGGAGVKLCGSGGAVVGVVDDPAICAKLAPVYLEAGFRFLQPRPARTAPPTRLREEAPRRRGRKDR